MSNFAQRLKKLREERGLSQKNLADIFNYSRTTISNYEHDKRLPDINVLCQLAQFFGVSTDYLIGHNVISDKNPFLNENKDLHNTFLEIIEITGQLCLNKSHYKENHQKRVAEMAVAIGKKFKLNKKRINLLRISALLHDLGEIYIPGEILNKPTTLSTIEYNLVKKHPEYAFNLLKDIVFFKDAAIIILQHHERIDGSGYPYNLTDKMIKIESKIIAVADVIIALTSQRSYREALKIKEALKILIKGKDIKYDSEVVNACIEIFRENQEKY